MWRQARKFEEKEIDMTPFDIVNTITNSKVLKDDGTFESAYIPFLINRNVSFFVDTLFFANEMNLNSHLTKKQQFDYYFHSIKPRKRYAKWPKKNTEDENLEMVEQYFGYNNEKAKSALALLNETQIKTIKNAFIKGGLTRNDK